MADANVNNTFTFELVSPERKLMSGPVRMVTVPGTEGDFGVLPGHSSLLATIRPGVVKIVSADGAETTRIFIAGGFADVTPNHCTVLAEQAVNLNDLNETVLTQSIRNLQDDLSIAADGLDKAKIQRRLDIANAQLKALQSAA